MDVQEKLSHAYLIRDLFQDGRGVAAPAEGKGRILSVEGAIPGDHIAIHEAALAAGQRQIGRKDFDFLSQSLERQSPFCPHFPACGSCAVEEMGYGAFAEVKRAQLEHLFGRTVPLKTGAPFGYRHKVFWHFARGRFGYMGRGSAEVQEMTTCRLLAPPLDAALQALNARAHDLLRFTELAGLYLRCNQAGELCFLLVWRAEPPGQLDSPGRLDPVFLSSREAARAFGDPYSAYRVVEACLAETGYPLKLSGLNFRPPGRTHHANRDKARRPRSEKMPRADLASRSENLGPVSILIQPEFALGSSDSEKKEPHLLSAADLEALSPQILTETISERRFQILPGAFFQVNPALFGETCRDIAQYLDGVESAVEFFSGTGALGQASLARDVAITALELSALSLLTSERNAALNGFTRYQARRYDLNAFQERLAPVEAVILDPPRAGLSQRFIQTLARADFRQMVYLSCHPAALKRDLLRFEEAGLHLRMDAQYGYDYFPWTMHVETVCLMTRV